MHMVYYCPTEQVHSHLPLEVESTLVALAAAKYQALDMLLSKCSVITTSSFSGWMAVLIDRSPPSLLDC